MTCKCLMANRSHAITFDWNVVKNRYVSGGQNSIFLSILELAAFVSCVATSCNAGRPPSCTRPLAFHSLHARVLPVDPSSLLRCCCSCLGRCLLPPARQALQGRAAYVHVAGGRSPPAQHETGPESDAAAMRAPHRHLPQPSISVGRLRLRCLQKGQAAVWTTHLTALIISHCLTLQRGPEPLGTWMHPLLLQGKGGMDVTAKRLLEAVAQSDVPPHLRC